MYFYENVEFNMSMFQTVDPSINGGALAGLIGAQQQGFQQNQEPGAGGFDLAIAVQIQALDMDGREVGR
jgi:hypothetical protein